MGSLVVLLLTKRARSEGARSTRALEDQPGYPVKDAWEGGCVQWGIHQAFPFDPSHTSRVKEAMRAVKGAIPLVVNVGAAL